MKKILLTLSLILVSFNANAKEKFECKYNGKPIYETSQAADSLYSRCVMRYTNMYIRDDGQEVSYNLDELKKVKKSEYENSKFKGSFDEYTTDKHKTKSQIKCCNFIKKKIEE